MFNPKDFNFIIGWPEGQKVIMFKYNGNEEEIDVEEDFYDIWSNLEDYLEVNAYFLYRIEECQYGFLDNDDNINELTKFFISLGFVESDVGK